MAVFSPKSRYRQAAIVNVADRRGRTVSALGPVIPPPERMLGEHLRREGQRLDHLAARYLDDPEGYWRLTELNDVISPEVLAAAATVKIPMRS